MIVMFFPNPLFGGSKRQPVFKNMFWDRISIFHGLENQPLELIFIQKTSKGEVDLVARSVPESTWARVGAENAPRMFFRFWNIFDWFGMDFETIQKLLSVPYSAEQNYFFHECNGFEPKLLQGLGVSDTHAHKHRKCAIYISKKSALLPTIILKNMARRRVSDSIMYY